MLVFPISTQNNNMTHSSTFRTRTYTHRS